MTLADLHMLTFVIPGIVHPYVRMTRRGKWTNDAAQEYLASQAAVGMQLRAQMAEHGYEMLPPKVPLSTYVIVYRTAALHRCDLDNIVKAVHDAAQGVVFRNDCWIDSTWQVRHIGDVDLVKFGVGMMVECKTGVEE